MHWDEEEIESETQLTEKKERRKSGEIWSDFTYELEKPKHADIIGTSWNGW